MSGVGALIQLMSKGKQNEILNANPQITFWRYRHMKYTDFALEHAQVTGGGSTQTLSTSEQSFDLPRSGDLVNDCFACFHLPGLANVVTCTVQDITIAAGDYSATTTALGADVTTNIAAAAAQKIYLRRFDKDALAAAGRVSGGVQRVGPTPETAAQVTQLTRDIQNAQMPYFGAQTSTGDLRKLGFDDAGADLTWVQACAGPDPFNLDTYWCSETRAMRPYADSDKAPVAARALSGQLEEAANKVPPSEKVQYLSSGSSNTAVADFTGKNFEMIETAEERQRYHLQANMDGKQALTVPGPQPYWCNGVGQHLIDLVRLKVGSQYVDTLYDHYLNMWDELSDKPGRSLGAGSSYGAMTMKGSAADRKRWSQTARTVYVPIPMFFMRTSGNALPLIALQFHGVQISIKPNNLDHAIMNFSAKQAESGLQSNLFENNNGQSKHKNDWMSKLFDSQWNTVVRETAATDDVQEHLDGASYLLCTKTDNNKFNKVMNISEIKLTLNVGYVYLNVSERNKFADASFEILIDQVQDNGVQTLTQRKPPVQSLSLNHCVQELVWACTRQGIRREPFDYTGRSDTVSGAKRDNIESVQLRLNNSTRFNQKSGQRVPGNYFRTVEPYLHHTRVPDNHVYAYSFALNPESEQPSGAVNMSRVDQAKLDVTLAKNLNVGGAELTDSTAREAALKNTGAADPAYHKTQLVNSGVDLHLYARNWNIFRITLGLGGVKWAS